jgi:hypothetical protein
VPAQQPAHASGEHSHAPAARLQVCPGPQTFASPEPQLHAPEPLQLPNPQVTHAVPPLPHSIAVCDEKSTHRDPMQQPWQVDGSHSQVPLEQSWPGAQASSPQVH